jgi:hypothetical protein
MFSGNRAGGIFALPLTLATPLRPLRGHEMRLFACLTAVATFLCWNGSPCVAEQADRPATRDNLPDSPARAPLKPPAKDTEALFPPVVPDDVAVKEAQELIKQAYEGDYKGVEKNPEPLIEKLLAAASQTKDPVRKYAFLLSAEQAAVTGSDHDRAMELIDIRASEFAVNGLQSRIERLADFLTPKAKTNPEALAKLYDHAIETAERGVRQDLFEQAKAAAEMAGSISESLVMAGKAKKNYGATQDGEAKQTQARMLVKDIERRADLFAEYQKALEVIRFTEDPAANGVIGRHLCFTVGDWDKGLPFLAKGDQADVAEVAGEELRMLEDGKPDAEEVFALAGKWWAAADAEDMPRSMRTAVQSHAGGLYESIRERLDDPLDRAMAQKRSAAASDPAGNAETEGGKPVEPGTGLLGEYFAGTELDARRRVLTRIDTTLARNFNKDPVGHGVPGSNFSIRWSGYLVPQAAGSYEFVGYSDDGVRIAIDGKVILNEWRGRAAPFRSEVVKLKAGKKHKLVVEYFDTGKGNASFFLDWQPEGLPREPIPTASLYPLKRGK